MTPSRAGRAALFAIGFAGVTAGCNEQVSMEGDQASVQPPPDMARPAPVADPAMALAFQTAQAPAAFDAAPAADPVPAAEPPTAFTIDPDEDRVYLPDRGWIAVAAFLEMYENHPQTLPGDLNHDSIMALQHRRLMQPESKTD